MEEEIVLCAANSYEQKYYLNPEFEMLPESIKQELNIMCVLYTEDVGGILMVFYDEDGNLEFRVDHEENDFRLMRSAVFEDQTAAADKTGAVRVTGIVL